MAEIVGRAQVNAKIVFEVDESEARALDALVGYGDDAFIKEFKEKLGTHYMRDHEGGLRKFFKSIRALVPPILSRIDDARAVFEEGSKRAAQQIPQYWWTKADIGR